MTGAPAPAASYARRVGPFSATMMVVGGVIGAGIFLNPSIVAQRLGTPSLTLLAWGLGALIALLGAFIFAELGARAPRAGGGYVYLRDAFGPLPAFLYGWALLLAIASGAIAAVAVTFARYAASIGGYGEGVHAPLGVAAIVLLSGINIVGVRPGAITQNVFTVLKLAAIAMIVAAGVGASGVGGASVGEAAATRATSLFAAMGTALVPVLFAYGGWQQTNFVAEEIVAPQRNLPRALILGVLIVGTVYLLANVTYLGVLGVDGLAASTAPASDVLERRLGDAGRTLIAAGIAISTFGFLNLVILVTPRVYQAMARDGLFFRRLSVLHPRWRTPVAAILLQGTWAIVLLLSGSYGQLLDWVTFADWIFFGATAATLFVYRQRGGPATFRAPLHPVSTVFFMLTAAYVVWGAVVSNPRNALLGTVLLAAGVPAYLVWRRRFIAPAPPAS